MSSTETFLAFRVSAAFCALSHDLSGKDGQIIPLSNDRRGTKWHQHLTVGHVALQRVKRLVFENQNRVVRANRCLQQTEEIGWRPWGGDLQPRDVQNQFSVA